MNPTKTILLTGFSMIMTGSILFLLNLAVFPLREYTLINVGIGMLVMGALLLKVGVKVEAVQ